MRFAFQVTAWLVILVLLSAIAAAVLVPRLIGGTAFTVLTGSMAPTYPPGTLVVDRPVDPEDIRIGSVVTFQVESGRPDVVTHRVIAVRAGANGEPEFITKGDANAVPDADWRPSAAVRGEVWYAVPHLGRVDGVLSGHTRQLGVYAVAGLLVVYAGATSWERLATVAAPPARTSPPPSDPPPHALPALPTPRGGAE